MTDNKAPKLTTEIRVLITTTENLESMNNFATAIVASLQNNSFPTKVQIVEKETRIKEVVEGTKYSINLILQD